METTRPRPPDNVRDIDTTEQRLRRIEAAQQLQAANIDLLVSSVALLVRCLPPPPEEVVPLYREVRRRLDEWTIARAEAAQHLYPHDEQTQPGVRLRAIEGAE